MLKKALGIAGALLLSGVAALAQDDGPIRIGLVLAKTGPFAESGSNEANGAQLALQQAGGKVMGHRAEVVWLDEPSPQSAQQNFSRLVEEYKVSAIIGGSNSASSLSMESVATRTKTPLLVVAGAAREITGKECNRYTFRTQLTIPVGSRAIAPIVLEKGKKWYFLSAAYALGQDTYASMSALLKAAGGQEVGRDDVPVNTSDYSSFLLKIRTAKPDAVIVGIGGVDFNNLLKQWNEFGFKDKIAIAAPVVTDAAMWAVGPSAAVGIYAKQWHYSDPSNSADEDEFVKLWTARVKRPPPSEAWQGWLTMRMLLAAIEQSKATDGPSIVKALESLRLQAGGLPIYYRSWDHQLIRGVKVLEGRAPEGDQWDMMKLLRTVPQSAADLDPMYGSQAEIGCLLGEL